MDSRSFEVVLTDGRRAEVRSEGDPQAPRWVAYARDEGSRPVGSAALTPRPSGSAEVDVQVEPGFRRRGLGNILFDTLMLNALEHGFDRLVARADSDGWLGSKLERLARARRRGRNSRETEFEVPVRDERRTLVMSGSLPTLPRRRPNSSAEQQ